MPVYKRTNDNQGRVQPTGGDYYKASGVVKDILHIVTAAEETSRVIATGFRYDQGLNSLEVFLNGQLLRCKETIQGTDYGDYVETSNFTVTFETGVVHSGDQVRFRVTANSYDKSNDNNANLNQLAKSFYGRDVTTGLLKNNGMTFGAGLVNVYSYATEQVAGYGYCHEGTIEDALADIGSDSRTLYIPNGTWRISPASFSLIIPSNVGLKIEKGAVLEIATGVTLTINGPFEAGLYQVFDCVGTGEVVFGSGSVNEVYPEWWGINGDTSPYDTAAVQAAFTSGENIRFTRTYYVTSVILDLVNANRVVDFNGFSLIGVASVATSSVLEIKENFLTAYKVDVNVNFNTNYTCAVQWRSDATHTSQYNKIYGLHIWYAMIGLIYGENIGTSSYSAAQSENTIYSFTTHGVQVPLVGNQNNGFLYLVSPIISCAPTEWVSQPGYNGVTWWTSAYSFNNPVGVLVITGGEILKAGPQGYGIRGKSFYIYGAYLEVASTLGYLTGSATIVNSDSYQGEASTEGYLFVVDRAATGKLYIRKMDVARLTGLGGTEGNVAVQTDNASDISSVYTVEVHDVEFTEWNVGLYAVAPFITNCAFRVSNIVSKGSTWTTFHIESHNPHLSITVPMSFETGEQTTTPIPFPETVTITAITGVVVKALAAADAGTIQGSNATGNSADGLLTFNASAVLNTTNGPHTPTTNMVVLKGASYTLTSAKTTAGGKVLVTLHYKKGL